MTVMKTILLISILYFASGQIALFAVDDYLFDNFIVHNNDGIRKHTVHYNNKQQFDEMLIEIQIANQWEKAYKIVYEYNPESLVKSKTTYIIRNDKWIEQSRNEYTRDLDGNLIYDVFLWHSGTQFEPEKRVSYVVDKDGKISSEVNEQWVENNWVQLVRYGFEYDVSGNLISKLWESKASDKWDTMYRYTYAYGSKQNQVGLLIEKFDKSGQFLPSSRTTSQYDVSESRILNSLNQRMLNGNWVNEYYYDYKYDINSDFTSLNIQQWSGEKWENFGRQINTYNPADFPLTMDYELWSGSDWYHGPVKSFQFVDSRGTTFTYEGYKLEINYISGTSITEYRCLGVYPNPAFNFIDVAYPSSQKYGIGDVSYGIYDIIGIKITTPSLRDTPTYQGGETVRIDISHLVPGVYFVRIGDELRMFVKQ